MGVNPVQVLASVGSLTQGKQMTRHDEQVGEGKLQLTVQWNTMTPNWCVSQANPDIYNYLEDTIRLNKDRACHLIVFQEWGDGIELTN